MNNNNSFAEEIIPTQFFLSQNYPNPFKEKTVIKYCVPLKTKVHIAVYNTRGEMLKELVNEIKNPGTYEVEFKSAVFSSQSSIKEYFYRLEAGDYKFEKKMILIK